MKENPLLVSVIVPCRNERRHIEAFLDDLLKQERDGFSCEFIVADGMSEDGTRAVLAGYARRHAEIRMIDNPRKIVSTGLNEAIRVSRGGIVARMDVHARYAPDFLKSCVEVLEQTGADNVGGASRAVGRGYWGEAIAAAFHSPFASGGAASRDVDYEGPTDTVFPGCWRKATLERLGLFDERLVRNQDDELNLRLTRSGGMVWQSRRIRSWYEPRSSPRKLFWQQFQYGFWKVAVIRKHKMPAKVRHLMPGLFVACLAALAAASALGAAFGWVEAARAGGALACALMASYAAASLVAGAAAAAKRGWRLLPGIVVATACFHFGYGLGFLAGVWAAWRPNQGGAAPEALTRLTR